MLQRIRDNASGPLAYVVVAVITVVFGVWGIGSYFTPAADPVVATIGSQEITRSQLQQAYDQRYQRLRQMMGDNFDPSLLEPAELRRTVLNGLIQDAVVSQYADDVGYTVSDDQLLAAIRSNAQFQSQGQFSAQRYRSLLSQAGLSAARYEARLRRDLKSRQLENEIRDSAFAAPKEVDQAYRLANQARQVRYLAFDPSSFRDQVEVSDAAIERYYQQRPDAFQRPERVRLAYVSLDPASAAPSGEPSEQQLRDLYANNQQSLGEPERRSGALLQVDIGSDADAARSTIQSLAGEAQNSEDWQALAADRDGVSYRAIDSARRQALAGDLGSRLFSMDTGNVSTPVRGDNAWYLLRLDSVSPASTPAFDDPEVQSQLRQMAAANAEREAYREQADRLESLAFEAPNSLEPLAEELGLEIQTTDGWVTREGGSGLGQYDAVRKAAFSDAVLMDGLNSTPLQLGAERRVVLRVAERQAAERRPLAEVRETIRERLIAERAGAAARDAAERALAQAEQGTDLAALAESGPASLSEPGFIQRSARGVDAAVRRTAFALPHPDAQAARYALADLASGGVGVVGLYAVRQSEESEDTPDRQRFAAQQRDYISSLEYAALSDYLRTRADVELDERQLN